MAGNRDTSSGISIRDVAATCHTVGREYGGDIEYHLVLPLRQDTGVLFHVRCVYRGRRLGTRASRADRMLSAAWPNGAASTLAGLFFKLLYDLERELEQAPVVMPRDQEEQTRWC